MLRLTQSINQSIPFWLRAGVAADVAGTGVEAHSSQAVAREPVAGDRRAGSAAAQAQALHARAAVRPTGEQPTIKSSSPVVFTL